MCVYVFMSVHVSAELLSTCFVVVVAVVFLRQCVSLNLGLPASARLTIHQATGIPLQPPVSTGVVCYHALPTFYMDIGDLNIGPCACITSNLPTELFSQLYCL